MDFWSDLDNSYWIIGVFTFIFIFFPFFSLYTNPSITISFSHLFGMPDNRTYSARRALWYERREPWREQMVALVRIRDGAAWPAARKE